MIVGIIVLVIRATIIPTLSSTNSIWYGFVLVLPLLLLFLNLFVQQTNHSFQSLAIWRVQKVRFFWVGFFFFFFFFSVTFKTSSFLGSFYFSFFFIYMCVQGWRSLVNYVPTMWVVFAFVATFISDIYDFDFCFVLFLHGYYLFCVPLADFLV